MSHKLAVITVVYQNYAVIDDLLESFLKQKNDQFHLFLTDLSSKREVVASRHLPLTILESKNLGYAHGVNLGIREAIRQGFDKFCVINSDIFFKEDFIDNVLRSLNNHPASIVGGKIYYAPGFEYHKKYSPVDLGKVLWYGGGIVDWSNVFTKHLGVDEVDKGQFDKSKETDFITGCLMCFDKKVIDTLGSWDENYFLYYEDADFCERAKRKSIKLYYDPKIIIYHKNAQSTKGSGSLIHQKYQKINRLKFGLKYAPVKTKLHLIKNYLLG